MNCKNCKSKLSEKDDFCSKCGGKIVKERISVKSLYFNLLSALGWESNFFVTLRHLLYKPQLVFKEYINGARKKYTNPFAFFAIILALSLFVFNQYYDQFIELSTDIGINYEANKGANFFGYENQAEFSKAIMKFQMKYYNLFNFLVLPIYTLMAFIVFRKPYNYGEHLIINTYLLGLITFFNILIFAFCLITKINIFTNGNLIVMLSYYIYSYNRLYKLTIGQTILKILKFIGILLIPAIISIMIGIVFMIIKTKILI